MTDDLVRVFVVILLAAVTYVVVARLAESTLAFVAAVLVLIVGLFAWSPGRRF